MENFGPWEIDVAPTVYPPREDTELLCRAISKLSGNASNAIEIGWVSGWSPWHYLLSAGVFYHMMSIHALGGLVLEPTSKDMDLREI